ncbi:MAG: hypothetical protein K1000chlam4_00130 [Chlamydiae bacterium]|nr:hypothetical protein [Chlamydiota bacterium]
MSLLRLFLIGAVMGIADLIPGVSGGTIAFITGIYKDLIESLQKFNLRFLLPLGLGVALAFITLSRLFSFLLYDSRSRCCLFAFFFGVVISATFFCLKKTRPRQFSDWAMLALGCGLALLLVSATSLRSHGGEGFLWLFFCGTLTTVAMLLPGISGSYLLNLLGVYPIALQALNHPLQNFSQLLPLCLGGSVGLLVFSGLIKRLLQSYPTVLLSLLIGFMVGGLRSLWPWHEDYYLLSFFFVIFGMICPILLQISVNHTRRIEV